MKGLLLLLMLMVATPVLALEYRGENTIFKDTVWQGEILIDGILTVALEATLEIRPGTRVRFVKRDSNADGIGESEIFAQGRLIARGTVENPVVFTSAEPRPAPGDWGALNMMMSENGNNLLEHCLIEYGYRGFHAHFSVAHLRAVTLRYNQRGAQFQESTVKIEDSKIIDNFNGLQFRDSTVRIENSRILDNHWGIRAVFVELEMEHNVLRGNRTNGVSLRDSKAQLSRNRIEQNRRGIYLQRSTATLTGNTVSDSLEHGIYLEDSVARVQGNLVRGSGRSGLKVLNSGGSVEGNRIELNGEYSINNAGTDDFNVGANWYGDGRFPQILDGSIRAGLGRLQIAAPLASAPKVVAP